MDDPGFECHDGDEIDSAFVDLVGRVQPVKGHAGPDHVQVRVGHVDDGAAIGGVPELEFETGALQLPINAKNLSNCCSAKLLSALSELAKWVKIPSSVNSFRPAMASTSRMA
jgi:hypothetical protein